jgi:hypothetical protein
MTSNTKCRWGASVTSLAVDWAGRHVAAAPAAAAAAAVAALRVTSIGRRPVASAGD